MNRLRIKIIEDLEILSSDEQNPQVEQLRRRWQKRFLARQALAATSRAGESLETRPSLSRRPVSERNQPIGMARNTQRWPAVAAISILSIGLWYFLSPQSNQRGTLARVFQLSKPVHTRPINSSILDSIVSKSKVIAGQDEIMLKSESVITDFSTILVASQASLQIREYRDGVGLQITSGELFMDFNPAFATKRYVIIPNRAVITITGTQVYARVSEDRTEVYLRHGKAEMETADGKKKKLKAGEIHDLRNSKSRLVSMQADEKLMRTFWPILSLPAIFQTLREVKNNAGMDFEAWRLKASASQAAHKESMLAQYPFVFKVFLPDGSSALVGAFEEAPAAVFSHEGKVKLLKQEQGKLVRLK